MTEQKKYEVTAPPPVTNYRAEVTVTGEAPWSQRGLLNCTVCDESLGYVETSDVVAEEVLQGRTSRHNATKHKDLLYVLTSAGWMQARDLIPDPVKQINDVIDKDMKTRGLVFPPGNPA